MDEVPRPFNTIEAEEFHEFGAQSDAPDPFIGQKFISLHAAVGNVLISLSSDFAKFEMTFSTILIQMSISPTDRDLVLAACV
jgi:hypothetical protein